MGNLDKELSPHPVELVSDLGNPEVRAAFHDFIERQIDDQLAGTRLKDGSLGEGDSEVLGAHQVDDVIGVGDPFEDEAAVGVCPGSHQSRRTVGAKGVEGHR